KILGRDKEPAGSSASGPACSSGEEIRRPGGHLHILATRLRLPPNITHTVLMESKGAAHVSFVPESGWPLVCGFVERISSSHCAIRTTLRQLGLFQFL